MDQSSGRRWRRLVSDGSASSLDQGVSVVLQCEVLKEDI